MHNNHPISSIHEGSQAKESDHWNSQPAWVKVIIKVCIALELGWYVGWMLHAVSIV